MVVFNHAAGGAAHRKDVGQMGTAPTARGRRIVGYTGLTLALLGVAVALAAPGDKPSISGDPRVGETLRSSPAGDSGVYKWQRCNPRVNTCGDTDRNDPRYQTIVTGGGLSEYTLREADAGWMIRVQAKGTSLGEQFVPSAPVGPVVAAPTYRETAVVDPTCPVTVKEPGDDAERVNNLEIVPVGTRINVTRCDAGLITARSANGEEQRVNVFGGKFKFFQRQKGLAVVNLKLVGKFRRFPPAGGAGAARAAGPLAQIAGKRFRRCIKIFSKRKCRKLIARGDCICSTSGALASGTVRGSVWYIQDGPGYTLAKAVKHKLLVRDKVKRKNILLHQGERYIARKRRRR
jgi:hypothetical protein